MAHANESATLGGGCFWCLDAVFRQLRGIEKVDSGYAGGLVENPSYRDVCTGMTGHAEVVQVTFDPAKVSYDKLLDVFWSVHDPTQLNRQGPDIGSNYRSVIFYHDSEQANRARKSKEDLQTSGRLGFGKVVTQIVPASDFWKAEEYHQQYFDKQGHCGKCKF
jgi:peptide-methionine (S)-S-oxide reductase